MSHFDDAINRWIDSLSTRYAVFVFAIGLMGIGALVGAMLMVAGVPVRWSVMWGAVTTLIITLYCCIHFVVKVVIRIKRGDNEPL